MSEILNPKSTDDIVDIQKYIYLFLSKWYWFAICIGLAITGAYLVNRYSDKIYLVEASMLVQEDKYGVMGGSSANLFPGMTMFKNKTLVANEMGILTSSSLAEKTIENLGWNVSYHTIGRRGIKTGEMYKSSPFTIVTDSSDINVSNVPIYVSVLSENEFELNLTEAGKEIRKTLKFGTPYKSGSNSFTIVKNKKFFNFDTDNSNEYFFKFIDKELLARQYKSRLQVDLANENGSTLKLSLSGTVPQKESDYINTFCKTYIQLGLDEKNKTADNSITFIDNQIAELLDTLTSAEQELLHFQLDNKVINLSQEGQLIFDKYRIADKEKLQLEKNEEYYKYVLNYITSSSDISDILAPTTIGISDPVLISNINKLGELYERRNDLLRNVVSGHTTIDNINDDILLTKETLIENLTNIISANALAINNISQEAKIIDESMLRLPVVERELLDMQRRFDLYDGLYTFLLQRRAEAGISRASNVADHKIIDKAKASFALKTAPKTTNNYIMALLLGLIAPALIIFIADFLDNTIREKTEIEKAVKFPVIGLVSHNFNQDEELAVVNSPRSSLSESFRSLRTNLGYLQLNKDSKVISVTSSASGEGKTFCAANLAAIIAMNNQKVLVIGLDLRKPKIHKDFKVSRKTGVSTYLIGENSFDEVVSKTSVDNLDIVASGPIPPNPAELISSEKMSELIQEARSKYDYIIIDTPPLAVVTDTLLLKDMTDCNLFVIRQNYSDRGVLEYINNLADNDVAKFNIVINDVQIPVYYGSGYGSYFRKYGYGYGYGYGYEYGQGYYTADKKGKKKENRIFKHLFS